MRYIRTMPLEDDNSSAIGRSWKSTFQCQTKAEAEAAMAKIGTEWEWLANGDVRTTSAVVPAIRTDKRTGRKMFFNSIVAAFTGWIDSRNDPTKSVVLGDGSPVNAEALLATAAFQRDNRVAFPWQAGDIIIIDNFTTMHSRIHLNAHGVFLPPGGPSLDGFATGSGSGQQKLLMRALRSQRLLLRLPSTRTLHRQSASAWRFQQSASACPCAHWRYYASAWPRCVESPA